ncbi:MAG TPA: SAM-dependent methyltransferase [Rhabdochlamydiaceae bacterium]|nr:SAM-dependent methyltransferase [Rhabdochlamydiaceae bacterium]
MKKLFLLPNTLHEESSWSYIPPKIDALIAESDKEGYRYLKRLGMPKVPIYLLNEHTEKPAELVKIPQEIVGLISDAGLPCLADPGSPLVAAAKKKGIVVEALPGPSSLMMALQLSGFSGQAFTFHGYFPYEALEAKIRSLPKKMAHLFIEAPYRTEKVFKQLLSFLQPQDQLCVACELMGPEQFVETHVVQDWKSRSLPSGKPRAVFVIWKQ